jgi:hypothetical protein
VELLAVLVGTGVRVGVAVDSLKRPLGILEGYLLILLLVTLLDDLLLALPLPRGCAVAAWMLILLLTELLCKLLDFPALLHIVAPGVVYRAPQTALITTGGLLRPLVATWAMTPTDCCSSGSNNISGSANQRLLWTLTFFFLFLPLL